MCGITGIYQFDQEAVESERIQKFNDSLSHRGPDGSGISFHLNKTVALGHRRLSILDLSEKGKQPMTYAEGQLTITYNGEIFNFIELREELQKLGHQFRSDTDTEVILAAYQHWGERCISSFNGMWAFAIWDELERKLFISRDRFGIKPLYYLYKEGEVFAFASETNAFGSLEGFRKEIDWSSLQLAIKEPYALQSQELTIYKDIRSVPSGSNIIIEEGGLRFSRWYSLDSIEIDTSKDFRANAIQLKELFEDSVRLRLRSDVNLATALSGGLDSSSVFAVVSHISQKSLSGRVPQEWQKAFVGVFPGTKQDEQHFARQLLEALKAKAHFIDIASSNALADSLLKTTRHSEVISSTPLLTLSSIYHAMKNEGFSISLDGHGVDEMMFGYRSMVSDLFYNESRFGVKSNALNYADTLTHMSQLNSKSMFDYERLIEQSFGPIGLTKKFLKRLLNRDFIEESSKKNWIHSKFGQNLRKWHFQEYTLPSLLRDFDKASMLESVEIRMPFMDYRLVEHVFSTPIDHSIGNGYTKFLLRESMKGVLPEELRLRRSKFGLQSPLESWFSSELKTLLGDVISSVDFKNYAHSIGNTEAIAKFEMSFNQGWNRSDATYVWKHLNAFILVQSNVG